MKFSFADRLAILGTLLLLASAATGAQSALEESPEEVIRRSNEEILELYRSRDEADEGLQRDVFAVMDSVTDFERLADAAVGGPCEPFPAEDCATLEATFVELLRAAAIKRLGRYRADRFEYLGETVDGESAVVQTLAFYGEDAIPLEYRLDSIDGRWLIVDYEVSEVPTVDSYRRQFSRLLKSSSVEDVVARLQRRIDRFGAESGDEPR